MMSTFMQRRLLAILEAAADDDWRAAADAVRALPPEERAVLRKLVQWGLT